MSLFGSLNSATAGLRTVQANLNVVSDNITRVNDPDRTRHTLTQKTDNLGQVVTAQYQREVNTGLKAQLDDLQANEGRTGTQNTYMTKLGDLLRTSNGKPLLSSYADTFATAWKTLQTSPDSETAQYQAIQAANTYAREINRVSTGVEAIDTEMDNDTKDSVQQANELISQISDINDNVVSLKSLGSAANEAQDRRDALVGQLNQLVGVKSAQRSDGRVALFTTSGLALLDADKATLTYTGGKIFMQVGNNQQDITQHLQTGKIGALYDMRKDGSKLDPPEPASSAPTSELIRKLRSQLDALANAFTSTTKQGEPTSFRDAYNNAEPLRDGELNSQFFVGTDRFTFAVNTTLLEDTKKIKTSAIEATTTAMNATGRSFTADGLSQSDLSYTGMVSAVVGNVTSTAATVNARYTNDKEARTTIEERYRGDVGVNMDEELALLQQLQTSYAASARVMQVTNKMFDTLEGIVQ